MNRDGESDDHIQVPEDESNCPCGGGLYCACPCHDPPEPVRHVDELYTVTVDSLLAMGEAVDLVGMVEIGDRLGVSRQTVRQWQQREILPEPDFRISGTPGWKWQTIEKWATKTDRLPTQRANPA